MKSKKKKSLTRIIIEERIKNTTYDVLFLIIIFALSWVFNKWMEMFIYIFGYTFIRLEFTKAVHGADFTDSAYKGIKYCRYITFIVQLISLVFIVSINISRYFNIILAIVLGVINFLAKDYLEYKIKKIKFYKGMKAEDFPDDLVGIEYDIMYKYYVKREKLDKIAFEVHYTVDNVKKIKRKILDKYS